MKEGRKKGIEGTREGGREGGRGVEWDHLSLAEKHSSGFSLPFLPPYLNSLATVSWGLCRCWAVATRFTNVSALLLSGSWGGREEGREGGREGGKEGREN